MRSKLLRVLRPTVRILIALATLSVALPRLPFWIGPTVVYPLHLFPQEVFGWFALVTGSLLLATVGRWRLRAVGRAVSVLAFAFWVTLAFATSSATSMMIDGLFAYAAFTEIIAMHNGCDE